MTMSSKPAEKTLKEFRQELELLAYKNILGDLKTGSTKSLLNLLMEASDNTLARLLHPEQKETIAPLLKPTEIVIRTSGNRYSFGMPETTYRHVRQLQVQVENINIEITPDDKCVVVNLYPRHGLSDEPIVGTYAYYSEGELPEDKANESE